ncbi:potassium channel family protein [Nonomuraea sp. NPDC003804]|uniref:potassium channel family protein n=1 Tax=Nonomuraea sp. NPDC003804 TaxID=3154547 RepID=UPI0033B6BDB4
MPPYFWSTLWNAALIVALYYLLPVEEARYGWGAWARLGLFVAGVLLLVWGVVLAARRQAATDRAYLPVSGLILLTLGGLVLFALADYAVATRLNGQFVGLTTKTDALYFSMTTFATVGFGDIHASGQLGRGLLLVQMTFNLVVLATAASLMSLRIKERVGQREQRPPD